MMSHIAMTGGRRDLAPIVLAPTANINCDLKDNFYEELEQVFDQFFTYHMQILLGYCKEKYGREDRLKLTTGKHHIV
jgi:hypothetical protein